MGLPGSSSLATTVALGLVLALIASHLGESQGLVPVGDLFPKGGKSMGSSTPPPSKLQVGFYKGKCRNGAVDVEAFIDAQVKEWLDEDERILAWLLRMQFHDCFVRGCDASILIDENAAEKYASPNLSVRGFEVIDALKAALESQCPGIVSCADIIAIATKAVIKWGGGLDYPVQTGRKDGLRSNASDVNLPGPSMSVSECISTFGAKRFSVEEMVILLGGHTAGVARCRFFQDRLYSNTKQFDPNMDKNLRQQLMLTCPPNGAKPDNVAFLDQNASSWYKLDPSFYNQIGRNRGILPIDQALARDTRTSFFVKQLSDANVFNTKFANAMIKLQALDVLTGSQGQIRKVCSKFG